MGFIILPSKSEIWTRLSYRDGKKEYHSVLRGGISLDLGDIVFFESSVIQDLEKLDAADMPRQGHYKVVGVERRFFGAMIESMRVFETMYTFRYLKEK